VLGARSTVRFVVTEVGAIDSFIAARGMGRSAEYQAADFARITAVRPLDSAPSGPAPTWSPEQRQDAADQFAASRLAQPRLISDLDTSAYTQWVQVDGEVSGYRPGSTLHLAVTSEPVVLASVMVGRDGTASISAVVPIELLGIGEHRIRFVGTRVFDGLSVDDDGEIQLPAAVLEQIDRFDRGTDATVIVYGLNGAGGGHVSLRIVPLDAVPPWWTLLVVVLAGALGMRARRRGQLESTVRQAATSGAILLAAVPAIVLGWFATTAIVGIVGGAMALLLAAAVPAVRVRADEQPDVDDLVHDDFVL